MLLNNFSMFKLFLLLKLHAVLLCVRINISEGDRVPRQTESYLINMKITVNGLTQLELKGTRKGVTKFAEIYANWETGNYIEVPEGTDDAKVVETYKAAFAA